MSPHLFTYGSLMFAPVWQRVVRGSYRFRPAVLPDFARFAVKDETYPGLVGQVGACVPGMVYFGVTAEDWQRLDRFEGGDYRRAPARARQDDGSSVPAQAYIYLKPAQLTNEPWLPEAFDLARFMRRYCGD